VADTSLIKQAYRFELAPTIAQEEFLGACVGASRFWFNQGLNLVKERLDARRRGEDVRVPWSYWALCSELDKNARAELAEWQAELVCGTYQAGFEALGRALENYSRARLEGQRVGFPRFRRKHSRRAESVIFQHPRIIGTRRVAFHRRVGAVRTKERLTKLVRLLERDEHARILRSTVTRRNGRWFVSFTIERSAKQRRARRPHAVVGVDVGLRHLATASTGEQFPNGRPLQAVLHRLRRLQRQLNRQRRAMNPGNYLPDGRIRPGATEWHSSQRMQRTQRRIRRLHERAANLRSEQAHRLTTALTREFGVLGVEGLAVKNMLRDRTLARRIADVGWGEIMRQLAYKTAWSEGLDAGSRRPLLSLLEDMSSLWLGESQAWPRRDRLHLRAAGMRLGLRPRPERSAQPGRDGARACPGGGTDTVLRRPHRTGGGRTAQGVRPCAWRAGKTRSSEQAPPDEARRLARAIPDPRGPGCRHLTPTESDRG
jgi:putative transposase